MQAWRKRAAKLGLGDQQVRLLVDKIAHQGDGELMVRQQQGFTAAEVTDMMLDYSYERCPECRWFVEVGELIGEDDKTKPCDQCTPRGMD